MTNFEVLTLGTVPFYRFDQLNSVLVQSIALNFVIPM